MSIPSEDVAVKVATDAATAFITSYYAALNKTRSTLSTFYITPTPISPQGADISLNGNIVPSPSELQHLFETQMPKADYEAQSYDCHVLNPNYVDANDMSDAALVPDATGFKMSLLVVVSGYVKYGDQRDAKMRGFTENFVLVPNRGSGNGERKWLIQSQNFRMVL